MTKIKNRFIEKTFLGAVSFFKEAVYNEEYSTIPGFLQRMDPRVKLITILFLILTAALVKSVSLLAVIYILSVAAACASRINVIYFLKRVWIFIPIFAVVIAVPAIFSFFTPGDAVVQWTLFSFKISITAQGVKSAVIFVLRVAVSVSLVVLLALTTRHAALFKALRSFRIPPIFVMTLEMTYRFLFLFVKNIEEMFSGIESRTVKRFAGREGRRIVAHRIGTLWEKSVKMSEDVYMAMVSRGYGGEPKSFSCAGTGPGAIDIIWTIFVIVFIAAVAAAGFWMGR